MGEGGHGTGHDAGAARREDNSDACRRRRIEILDTPEVTVRARGPGAGVGAPVEETLSPSSGAPLEVLRLVVLDGMMEMRFCGARVQLGPLMT